MEKVDLAPSYLHFGIVIRDENMHPPYLAMINYITEAKPLGLIYVKSEQNHYIVSSQYIDVSDESDMDDFLIRLQYKRDEVNYDFGNLFRMFIGEDNHPKIKTYTFYH